MNAGATLQPRPTHQPIHQWEYLSLGDSVKVCLEDLQYAGWAEAVGDRGHLIWVIENGTADRRLFLRGDGVTLCPI